MCVYAGGDLDHDSRDALKNSSTFLGKRTQSQTQTNLEQAQNGLNSRSNKKREPKSNDKTPHKMVLQADEISNKQQVKAAVNGKASPEAIAYFSKMMCRNRDATIQTGDRY